MRTLEEAYTERAMLLKAMMDAAQEAGNLPKASMFSKKLLKLLPAIEYQRKNQDKC